MVTLKEIIELLQSSQKIVFVLTFGALLIILQDIYLQLFPLDQGSKTISYITMILGGLFLFWDFLYAFGRWLTNLNSLYLTEEEFFILKKLWDSPNETIFLNREKISSDDLSNLKIIISDLINNLSSIKKE